jgi:signal transduction histidine kinase
VDLALRRSRSPEELVDALRSAREETDRLARLAEDLLVIARADQGRLPVRPEAVELAPVLTDLSRRFARRFDEGGRDLTVDVDGLVVSADRLRLEQAVGNLMDNALRHGRGRVRLWADEDGEDRVRIHVSDDGPGFSADFLPSAFERFTRADPARSRGGTGLGLAIVEAIARAHGGTVRAEQGDGGGADVWIALPRVGSRHRHREPVGA